MLSNSTFFQTAASGCNDTTTTHDRVDTHPISTAWNGTGFHVAEGLLKSHVSPKYLLLDCYHSEWLSCPRISQNVRIKFFEYIWIICSGHSWDITLWCAYVWISGARRDVIQGPDVIRGPAPDLALYKIFMRAEHIFAETCTHAVERHPRVERDHDRNANMCNHVPKQNMQKVITKIPNELFVCTFELEKSIDSWFKWNSLEHISVFENTL